MTSKLARKSRTLDARIVGALLSMGPLTCWELVRVLNAQRESYTHGDREPREITIDSVSTCMRPMCRRGEVHEVGTKENTVRGTGNRVIVWAAGPAEDWSPGSSMPAKATGHTKLKFKPFTEAEIEEMGKAAGKYVDIFTTLLNLEIEKRIS